MIPLIIVILLVTLILLAAVCDIRLRARAKPETAREPILYGPGCGFALILLVLLFLWGICIGPINSTHYAMESTAMQTTRTLALAMFQYANDNNAYPDGASSTEVFQKLMDGNYVSDPSVFYIPMWGKTPARAGAKLRPENVCFDVTSGIQMDSPDMLPIVFVTGFRMDYHKSGAATSLVRPFPCYHSRNSWFPWSYGPFGGLAVAYKKNNAWFRNGQAGPNGFGVVPNVIPADFDAHGKTYRQLTPEGVLK
jgi:hypothetical protein